MKCLYIVFDQPLSPNAHGGGAAICYDQLMQLTDAGVEVALWHQSNPSESRPIKDWQLSQHETWNEVRNRCASVAVSRITPQYSMRERAWGRMMRALKRTNPLVAFNLRSYLEKLIEMHRPDFIWAQHFQPTLVATRQRNVPVVYSHHDWLYRIKALRHGRPEDAAQRTQEHEVVRRCNAAVCGSATERGELIAAGCPNVAYLPVSYKPVPVDMGALDTNSPRLVHLGGMGTTANREGLRRFFEIVWPLVSELGLSLDVVGDLSGSSDCLMASLNRANCLGFVPDLSTVLRPGDIHVIAWEHNTGQRTRFPLALNHGQVVVATRASVACFPEARDGENCRLVPRLEDMAVVLKELVADKNQRQRLAISGRDTFLRSFTREAMLPRYEELLESLPLRANGQPLATKRTDGDAIQRTHKGNPQPYETIR